MEFPTDRSNTSENICAVDWGAITGVLRGFFIVEKDVMHSSVLACDFLCFVDKGVIFFNAHAFVIPARKRSIDYPQCCTHIFGDSLEHTVSVDYNNCNHAEQENDSP